MTKAAPLSGGMACKNRLSASIPPADAPMPMIGIIDVSILGSGTVVDVYAGALPISRFLAFRVCRGSALFRIGKMIRHVLTATTDRN